jgi:hypothetical protein
MLQGMVPSSPAGTRGDIPRMCERESMTYRTGLGIG